MIGAPASLMNRQLAIRKAVLLSTNGCKLHALISPFPGKFKRQSVTVDTTTRFYIQLVYTCTCS